MHVTAIVPSEELAMQVDNNGQFEDLVICIFYLKSQPSLMDDLSGASED